LLLTESHGLISGQSRLRYCYAKEQLAGPIGISPMTSTAGLDSDMLVVSSTISPDEGKISIIRNILIGRASATTKFI